MADLGPKSIKKNMKKINTKRKLASPEVTEPPSKIHRTGFIEKAEESMQSDGTLTVDHPWRNLQLILSIQNKQLDLQKKIELSLEFVRFRANKGDRTDDDFEMVKLSRLIIFLNDWIQSLLISSEKNIKFDGGQPCSEVSGTCLDYRCWEIFKFCLEESLNFHVRLSLSRNLLRAICCIIRSLLSFVSDTSANSKESLFVGEWFEHHSVVHDCVSLVFKSHGGLLNENLDLWVATADVMLKLLLGVNNENLDESNVGCFIFQFSCLVLDPFTKFLRVHPTRKNGFHDLVEKLLEPLLHLLGVLHSKVDGNENNPDWTLKLLMLAEDILYQGLFHPTHIDGFLSLQSTERYITSRDKKSNTDIKSYHRHLFDKLEIITVKNVSASSGIGGLFYVLVDRVKRHKGAPVLSEGTEHKGKTGGTRQLADNISGFTRRMFCRNGHLIPEKTSCSISLNAETRKSLFDFFVPIMEPLLREMSGHLNKVEVEPVFSRVHCTLKSINSLLATLMLEKLYDRTEDISEGACLNFFTAVYDMIMALSIKLLNLSNCGKYSGKQVEMFISLAKEVLVAIGYFLEIEYEIIGNDLVGIWLMMFSHLAIGISLADETAQYSLYSETVDLGCQLINLYSELRQVNSTIFALCKAVRLIISQDGDTEECSRFIPCSISLFFKAYAKSVGTLLCSQKFRLAIHNAIKSVPEGQASGCIRELKVDISDSIEWMKINHSLPNLNEFDKQSKGGCFLDFDLQSELLGRGLSEVYTLVLDSLTATMGNCTLIGVSVKDLMTVIRPCMGTLVGLHPNSVNGFLSSVTGRSFDIRVSDDKDNLLKFGVSTNWVFVFFFRLYLSCRSLYRQAISLMPPDSSRKMSAGMGDSFTVYSGRDWMEKTDWTNEGYFNWIILPSVPLLVVIQSVSEIYVQGRIANCCPLVYTLLAMAIQRVVELNRQINSLEYFQQSKVQIKSIGDGDLLVPCKKNKKWERFISILRKEAAGLTEFMMGILSSLADGQQSLFTSDDPVGKNTCRKSLQDSTEWDFDVTSVDGDTLPTAIWWILCQNTDIWCIHAEKKKLKLFLSLLISTSHLSVTSNFKEVDKLIATTKPGQLSKVTVHQISLRLLGDSMLYEQKFVRRHFASRFCRLLKKSALALFPSCGDVNFKSSLNWPEVFSLLDNPSITVNNSTSYTGFSCVSNELPSNNCEEQNGISPISGMNFRVCESLLGLLSWVPAGCLSSRSISLYETHILNLERLAVCSLVHRRSMQYSHYHTELLRLFMSCRKVLKYLLMASCEDRAGASQTSFISVLSTGSSPVLWLFKSVFMVVGLQEVFSEDSGSHLRDVIFSLMDHTSYVFLTISKHQFSRAVLHLKYNERPSEDQLNPGVSYEQRKSVESDPSVNSIKYVDAWKSVFLLAESLKEQTRNLFVSLKDALCSEKERLNARSTDLVKLSSLVSCFNGFLWGIASALDQVDADSNYHRENLQKRRLEPFSKLNRCLSVFADFIKFFSHMLLVDDDEKLRSLYDAQSLPNLNCSNDLLAVLEHGFKYGDGTYTSRRKKQRKSVVQTIFSASSDSNKGPIDADGDKRSKLYDANGVLSDLIDEGTSARQCLYKPLLQSLLKGDNPEAAFLLRQLLIAASAILRLNFELKFAHSLPSLVPLFTGLSQVVLLKFAEMDDMPQPFSFVWFDGVLKFLEELGSHFPSMDPTLSTNIYAKLVDLHIRAIGKCIALQGKRATLASHETESSTKMLYSHVGLSEASSFNSLYCLDEFISRLRMSFKVFIRRALELHLLSAVQAIERSLVGVQEDFAANYEINTGSADGGKVSPVVAASIDCLDLVLEFVTGHIRLAVVKRHIRSLIAGLFNIILHLKSPIIFYRRLTHGPGAHDPDPGSVILMCVEVLTRVSAKHAIFHIEPCHISQALRVPAVLFQGFHRLRVSKATVPSNLNVVSDELVNDPITREISCVIDRQFTIDLFAACCRLLYTVLKHHKSESERCIAVLEDSICALLHCLKTMNSDSLVRKGYFEWEVQEGVKCASYLRRIYEEIRQQKDVFGQHCFKFLSSYIWVYSGHGPLESGIAREIDEALRPGIYALIDACSADNLQYLHTVFGEGPCRNTLAALQHDYELNFQYGGKV